MSTISRYNQSQRLPRDGQLKNKFESRNVLCTIVKRFSEVTAASNERKRFLSWPRPVCQEPFTRTFAAAPMFHAIWIIIYPVTTSRVRRDCRTPSQKPRKKKDSNKLVGSGSFISEQGKSYANMCRLEQKEKISNYYLELVPLFLLDLLYYCSFSFFFFFCVCVCLCVCVCVVWCSLRDIHWSRRIQGRSVNELFESTISVLSRSMIGISDSCIKGAFSSYINMLIMGK